MSGWVNFNGVFLRDGTPVITADSRAFRYGDGLFETMRISDGQIRLKDRHFERLFNGISLLQMHTDSLMTASFLEEQVYRTARKNGHSTECRVRLTLFRGEGGLFEFNGPSGGYLIQTWPLTPLERLNENGLVTGIYDTGRKACDALANVKSNNYLLYVMAAIHAKTNRWNECMVLNTHGRVCDSTIANVFWVKHNRIFTPPLAEGCVAGVMRGHLLESLPAKGFLVEEEVAEVQTLQAADEIFLTNATSGIRWVQEFNGFSFGNVTSTAVFRSTF